MTRHNAALNAQRDLDHATNVNKAIHQAITAAENEALTNDRPLHYMTVDSRALRGIPAIGGRGSVGGAIAGTRPDSLAWLDERQRRKPRPP